MTLEQVGIVTALIAAIGGFIVSLISALTGAKQSEVKTLREAMAELRLENKRLLKRIDDGEEQHSAERKQWNEERDRLNRRISDLETELRIRRSQKRNTGPLSD